MKEEKRKYKLVTKNKKAYFDYEILDSWEAGIELRGYETKSIRASNVNLKGSFIVFRNSEAYIKNMHISAWKSLANKESIETERERKIFLKRKTIDYLSSKVKEAGLSVVALELYFSGSLIKLKVGLAKGRKAYQKKQVLKERDMDKRAKIAIASY
ncbi:SsrA-binding protein [Candidatus Gracilibacteria bacterium]|nr:MAG: SsrA-binding protein [Candidatus Gracilibacteria bacterium]